MTARVVTSTKIAIECQPWLGAPYTVYLLLMGEGKDVDPIWVLPSLRRPSREMLDAVDRMSLDFVPRVAK